MRKWAFLLISLILLTLQITWPSFLSIFRVKPDLLLVFSIAAVFYLDYPKALLISILCGLLKDIFLPYPMGLNTILFAAWSYLIYRLCRQISAEQDYMRLAIVFLVSLFNNIIILLQSLNSGNLIPAGIILRNLLVSSIYTAAVSPLIFKLTKKTA